MQIQGLTEFLQCFAGGVSKPLVEFARVFPGLLFVAGFLQSFQGFLPALGIVCSGFCRPKADFAWVSTGRGVDHGGKGGMYRP